MKKAKLSKTVQAKSRTYFFDVREAKSGKNYLSITESRYNRNSDERQRSTIIIFPDAIRGFSKTFEMMVQGMQGGGSKRRRDDDEDEDQEELPMDEDY